MKKLLVVLVMMFMVGCAVKSQKVVVYFKDGGKTTFENHKVWLSGSVLELTPNGSTHDNAILLRGVKRVEIDFTDEVK